MKKLFIKILSLLALVAAFASCKKEEGNPELDKIVGEWHYTNGETGSAVMDVYVVFNADYSFALYQKIGEGAYRKFTGSYTLTNSVLAGTYSNGTAWADSYNVSYADGALVLTSASNSQSSVKYSKKNVPEEVLNHYDDDTKAEASDMVPVL